MDSLKDKSVPSLDKIQIIEDLLEQDGKSEFDNHPIDSFFNGVREGIIKYFEHFSDTSVETDKEQPKHINKYLKNQKDMNKDLFVKMLDALRDQNDKDVERATVLSEIYGNDIDPTDNSILTSAIFQVMKEAFGSIALSEIEHFCFEQDYGRSVNRGAGQLWDQLLKDLDVEFEEVKG